MQWLLHGRLTQAAREALRRRGDAVHEPAELGLPDDAPAEALLEAARVRQWDLLTSDPSLAEGSDRLAWPLGRCIVLLLVQQGDVEQDDALQRLFARYRRLSPGRLYTVTGGRVKVRQMKQVR